MEAHRIIRRPHNSEKGLAYIEACETYVFEVDVNATKSEIKSAVETLWNVKVKSVRTVLTHGKTKRMGRSIGQSSDWKKAIVRLVKGQAIEALK